MTTLREAAEMALGTLQDVCARLLYRGVSKDAGHPDQIALEQARQTIQALKQATEQSKQKRDPIAWNGWIVREVLFDEGEPVGHRAPPQPVAQPEREPVAWAVYDIKHGGSKTLHWPEQHSPNGDPSQFKAVPLYSVPPQRKPLTNGEIHTAYITATNQTLRPQDERLAFAFARAIEQAHGIGDKE
jgi:hypothetical protein